MMWPVISTSSNCSIALNGSEAAGGVDLSGAAILTGEVRCVRQFVRPNLYGESYTTGRRRAVTVPFGRTRKTLYCGCRERIGKAKERLNLRLRQTPAAQRNIEHGKSGHSVQMGRSGPRAWRRSAARVSGRTETNPWYREQGGAAAAQSCGTASAAESAGLGQSGVRLRSRSTSTAANAASTSSIAPCAGRTNAISGRSQAARRSPTTPRTLAPTGRRAATRRWSTPRATAASRGVVGS